MKSIKINLIMIIIIIISILIFLYPNGYAVSKFGSNGEEVKLIQEKLNKLGYYKGKIDGIYNTETLNAVKLFQEENGIKPDGIVNNKTFTALEIDINKVSISNDSISNKDSDINLLSKVVYAEAKEESFKGQVAIAAVILNRVSNSSFPNTISGVIYEYQAFACVSDGKIDLVPDNTAQKAANDAINGWDPTQGALYYFNPSTDIAPWLWDRPQIIKIGKYIFCK